MCGRLHGRPDVRIGYDRNVVVDAYVAHRRTRTVGAVIGERQPDRPDQREDVDREQKQDGGSDEDPGYDPVRPAAYVAGPGGGGRRGASPPRRGGSGGVFTWGGVCRGCC